MEKIIKRLVQVELAIDDFCSKNGHLLSSDDKKSLRRIRSKIKSIRKLIGKNQYSKAQDGILVLTRMLDVFFGLSDYFDSFF